MYFPKWSNNWSDFFGTRAKNVCDREGLLWMQLHPVQGSLIKSDVNSRISPNHCILILTTYSLGTPLSFYQVRNSYFNNNSSIVILNWGDNQRKENLIIWFEKYGEINVEPIFYVYAPSPFPVLTFLPNCVNRCNRFLEKCVWQIDKKTDNLRKRRKGRRKWLYKFIDLKVNLKNWKFEATVLQSNHVPYVRPIVLPPKMLI